MGASVSGIVADGYLQGASVCLDLNRNGRCDGAEPSATTGSGGAFTLEVGDFSANDYPVVVEVHAGAIDEEAGPVAKGYTLRSPAGNHGFVSPLTTLVQTKIDENPALDADAAAQIVGLQLNVEDRQKLFTDYVASGAEDAELRALHQSAQVVARAFGQAAEVIAAGNLTGNLVSDHEVRAVQVVTGKLLLGKLDRVAVSVQSDSDAFDPDAAAASLDIAVDAGTLTEAEFNTVARQIAALETSALDGAGGVLPGHTVYSFEEDGTSGPHTLVGFERVVVGEASIRSMDEYDNGLATLDELDQMELDDPLDFRLDGTDLVFDGSDVVTPSRLTTTVVVDLAGLTFKLDDLALTKMQDTDLRAREVVFDPGDVMYKVKAIYHATDLARAAEVLDAEMAELPEYENGNTAEDLKDYVESRSAGFPIDDHAVMIGGKTYRKYFVPSAARSTEGTLKGVVQGDSADQLTLGSYRIEALGNGRAYIVMDLLSFAEVNNVWDHLLIVNDAQDNHDFEEVVIADTAGSKASEVTYFNRSAMEKIFAAVKTHNLP
jgi:hypothetical protein